MKPTSPSALRSPSEAVTNAYYARMWKSNEWGGREPNYDEQLRLKVIEELIGCCMQRVKSFKKILDVGCGRGWLTHQLRRYGPVQGIETVPEALEIARRMFPDLEFSLANPIQMNTSQVERYRDADLVVCSEVLEHVPDGEKANFLKGLATLIRPGGHLLITTPRGELWKRWRAKGNECQPVEEWVTEAKLSELSDIAGFQCLERRRIHVPGSEYHSPTAWLLRGRLWSRLIPRIKPLRNAIAHANGIYQAALFRRRAAV